MNKIITVFLFSFLILSFSQENIIVTPEELSPLAGNWKGSLTYVDYQTSEKKTLPVLIKFSQSETSKNEFSLMIEYPNEPHASSTEILKLANEGRVIYGHRLTKKEKSNGQLLLIAEAAGIDDNRNAQIRYTFTISSALFRIRKDVKFSGQEEWQLRNEFNLSR